MFAAAGSRVAEFIGKEKVRAKTFDGRLEADDGEDDRYWCREQKRRESRPVGKWQACGRRKGGEVRSRRETGDGEGGKDKVMKKAGKDKVGGEDEEGWDSGEGEEKSCRPCGIRRGVYKKPRIFVRGFLLFCLEKLFFVKSVFLFFRFVIRAGNVDQDGLADFRVKAELNLINAEVFDRAFEVDITAFNVNARLLSWPKRCRGW